MTDSTDLPDPVPAKPPFLPDKVYDVLKWVAIYVIAPLVVLLLAIGTIWHIDLMTPIAMTVAAVGTFLAGLLGYSTKRYNQAAGFE